MSIETRWTNEFFAADRIQQLTHLFSLSLELFAPAATYKIISRTMPQLISFSLNFKFTHVSAKLRRTNL